jgi:hypothetical protein
MHIAYLRENQKERDHHEDQEVGGWTILKWRWDGVDWIDVAQDRGRGLL